MTIRVAHVGLGPIGAAVVAQVATRRGVETAAAVDVDPAKAGRDAGEVCGLGEPLGVVVRSDLAAALAAAGGADVAVLCTGSSLSSIEPQIEAVLTAGLPIVSTTEELSFPFFSQPRLAASIDARARAAGLAVLGTGVNPGFAMDLLPIGLTGVCERVEAVRVDRVQDASVRRIPFQRKIGAGMSEDDFRAEIAAGRMGHVGLTESIAMIADALGWRLGRVTDVIEPKLAAEPVDGALGRVAAGRVVGIVQDGEGFLLDDDDAVEDEPSVTLHMEAYLGAPASYDRVRIDGSPAIDSTVDGGIHGDVATASIVVNSLPRILAAPPGLRSMKDLPVPSWWSGRR